ncbi:carbohydrate-binding domain-containing protein [Myxococcaceae bacterium GXIMD 01537]
MDASSHRRLRGALAALALASGCFGESTLDGHRVPTQGGEPTYDDDTSPPVQADGSLKCELSTVPSSVTLASVAEDFAREVYPAMVRESSGCVSCHSTTSGRLFTVGRNGVETFYAARAAGFFKPEPGSLLSRLASADEGTRMPRAQPSWSAREISAVASLTCQAAAVESRSPRAADEEFPPELLQPYSGPSVATYDNPFVGAVQLQGKVKQAFNDGWVRGGVDLFAQNVGLFGGVDYQVHFVEARVATPDFFLGLDKLAPDVCLAASRARTGPFAGVDTTAPVADVPSPVTKKYEMELAVLSSTTPAPVGTEVVASTGGKSGATGWNLWTTGTLTTLQGFRFPTSATYRFTVRARGDLCGADLPKMELRMDGAVLAAWDVSNGAAAGYADFTHTQAVTAGEHVLTVAFLNDYNESGDCDRNLHVDMFQVYGPTEATTGTQRADAAKARVDTLFRRLLYRGASAQEQAAGLSLVVDLLELENDLPKAWSGLCEGLMRSPDYLFTLPPSREKTTGAEKERLLLVKLAQDLLGRPPTAAEFQALETGTKTYAQLVDDYLASPDFRAYYFHKMRVRTESEGTPDTDEPARLWTYLATQEAPLEELLMGDYSVGADFTKVARPAQHGRTGVLTMKGFIKNKPGLPHYNYAARVMTDFMGTLYEVPAEVFDMRGAATAASTVDPTSICYTCHQTLTPLAHQRLRWDDEGQYRTQDVEGRNLDDSDRGLVSAYSFKGQGMEAFATQAVKKEAFQRRTLNAQFALFFGREMRHREDERALYKRLWDVSQESHGNLKAVLRTIALSPEYTRR